MGSDRGSDPLTGYWEAIRLERKTEPGQGELITVEIRVVDRGRSEYPYETSAKAKDRSAGCAAVVDTADSRSEVIQLKEIADILS